MASTGTVRPRMLRWTSGVSVIALGVAMLATASPAGASSPGAAALEAPTIEAIDWRPGVINDRTTETYAPTDTGGTLVTGLDNQADADLHVTGVRLDGKTADQLRDAAQLMWWRSAPTAIKGHGVGAVSLKLMTPYRADRHVSIDIDTDQGTIHTTATLRDEPLRLASITLNQAGTRMLTWVRNDGASRVVLPSAIVVNGSPVHETPSQHVLKRGQVAFYDTAAPGSGSDARYVSVGLAFLSGTTPGTAYAHLKVAPSFNASGGYGDSGANFAEQQSYGLNLVTRGLFNDPTEQAAFDAQACAAHGIKTWIAGAGDDLAKAAAQGTDPCVAGFAQDEPEWNGVWPFSKADDNTTMQKFADRLTAQGNAVNDTKMNYVDNAIGRSFSSFAMIADVAGNDHYTVDAVESDGDSSHPLEEAGYFSTLTRRAAEPRPSYDWAQMTADFSWATDNAWNRQATPDELRLQAYTMLQGGVKSLLWFDYRVQTTITNRDTVREAARVNREENLIRELVGEGTESAELTRVVADSTPNSDRVQVGALVGTQSIAALVANLDYTYKRVVWNKPIPPSPTPAATFTTHKNVVVSLDIPAWLKAGKVVMVDSAAGVTSVPFVATSRGVRVNIPSLRTTAMFVVLRNQAAVTGLQQRWATLSAAIPGADAPAAPGEVPPANAAWDDGNPHLALKWQVATRDINHAALAVRDGVAYAGSRDGYVRAISVASGAVKWSRHISNGVMTTPAVTSSTVYVTSLDGRVLALDRANGKVRWSRNIGSALQSSPVVSAGRVIFGSDDGRVHAIDGATGAPRWTSDVRGPVLADIVAATIGGRARVLVGSTDGSLYALDAATGSRVWRHDTGDQIVAAPAVSHGVVYVGGFAKHLEALVLSTGALKWSTELPTKLLRSPAVHGDRVVVGLTEYGDCDTSADPPGFSGFRALSTTDGSQLWETSGLGCDFGHSAPAYGDGAFFAGTAMGQVVRINPDTGSVEASLLTSAWVQATPVVVGQRLLIAADDQLLRAVATRP